MIDQAQNLRELMYKKRKKGARFVTITSGRKGAGKTGFALNLAAALKRNGQRVLVIRMGRESAEAADMPGALNDIANAIRNKRDPQDLVAVGGGGVMSMMGGNLYELADYDAQLMRNGFMRLEDIADVILFDAEGDSDDILRLVCASQETFLIITPDRDALIDGYAIVKKMSARARQTAVHLVLNKAENVKEAKLILNNFVQTVWKHTRLEVRAMGYILRDENVAQADRMKELFLLSFPACPAAGDMERLSERYITLLEREPGPVGSSGFLDGFIREKC